MKIIDILVNIANAKEVPIEIKYNNCLCSYDKTTEDYYCEKFGNIFGYLFSTYNAQKVLSTEVEIIEEEKDIEELEIIENFGNYYIVKDGKQCQLNRHDTVIIDKINELVREVNKIRRELKNND